MHSIYNQLGKFWFILPEPLMALVWHSAEAAIKKKQNTNHIMIGLCND